MAEEEAPAKKIRGSQIHPEIRPAPGKLKTVAIAQLFRHFKIGGQRWVTQFAKVFPISGKLSHRKTPPPDW